MPIPQTASGTTNDKQSKSFVDSPSRGPDYAAREVYVGNSNLDPIPTKDFRGNTKFEFNEVLVGAGQIQTIISKSVPPGMIVELLSSSLSGENKAVYSCLVDSVLIDRTRTYYTYFNAKFFFSDAHVDENKSIIISVENTGDVAANFSAALYYKEYNEN